MSASTPTPRPRCEEKDSGSAVTRKHPDAETQVLLPGHILLLPRHTFLLPRHTLLLPRLTLLLPKLTLLPPRHTPLLPRHAFLLPRHTLLLPRYTLLFPRHSLLLPRHTVLLLRHTLLLPRHTHRDSAVASELPDAAAWVQRGSNLNGCKDLRTENGHSQGQKPALTGSSVLIWLDLAGQLFDSCTKRN